MQLEVTLTPTLYAHRTLKQHQTTVAVDVLRATTAICAALQAGADMVVPLDSLEPLPRYRDMGFTLAAERGGVKVDLVASGGKIMAAEFGNSPTEYMRHDLHGHKLAYSTTNGTVSLARAADAERTLVGSFANISALTQCLASDGRDVVILCSGWEGAPCLEDTLFAGALAERLVTTAGATLVNDSATMALALWHAANGDPLAICQNATHVARLRRLGAEADIEFAFRTDTCPLVPQLTDGAITLIQP
ncbi:MAG: 2-phosphosulfolactate phosphatase [Bacteroidales bacterium]|nr:2-phosphosulfolactate phosphatase [Bacteroidales bacterium]